VRAARADRATDFSLTREYLGTKQQEDAGGLYCILLLDGADFREITDGEWDARVQPTSTMDGINVIIICIVSQGMGMWVLKAGHGTHAPSGDLETQSPLTVTMGVIVPMQSSANKEKGYYFMRQLYLDGEHLCTGSQYWIQRPGLTLLPISQPTGLEQGLFLARRAAPFCSCLFGRVMTTSRLLGASSPPLCASGSWRSLWIECVLSTEPFLSSL
jgi:hypothetical protein